MLLSLTAAECQLFCIFVTVLERNLAEEFLKVCMNVLDRNVSQLSIAIELEDLPCDCGMLQSEAVCERTCRTFLSANIKHCDFDVDFGEGVYSYLMGVGR